MKRDIFGRLNMKQSGASIGNGGQLERGEASEQPFSFSSSAIPSSDSVKPKRMGFLGV